MKLSSIVPWGRSYKEYRKMFELTNEDQDKRILGIGDGPASFNAEATALGMKVISVDPVYQFSKEELKTRIDETFDEVIEQTNDTMDNFVWNEITSVEELGEIRMKAMTHFLGDYELGLKEKRYQFGQLPKLEFDDNKFDLALCSHFLFLYSGMIDLDFHIQAIKELARVASEIRIFPLVDLNANKSEYVKTFIEHFSQYKIEIRKVDYEFQKGGNEMMVIERG